MDVSVSGFPFSFYVIHGVNLDVLYSVINQQIPPQPTAYFYDSDKDIEGFLNDDDLHEDEGIGGIYRIFYVLDLDASA